MADSWLIAHLRKICNGTVFEKDLFDTFKNKQVTNKFNRQHTLIKVFFMLMLFSTSISVYGQSKADDKKGGNIKGEIAIEGVRCDRK